MRGFAKGLLYFASGGYIGHAPERLRPIFAVLGLPMVAAIAGFSAYNLYSAWAFGQVFRSVRHGQGHWIAYADHRVEFAILTTFYGLIFALPALCGLLIVLDRLKERRLRRRGLAQALSGESATQPVTRHIHER